MIKRVWGFVIRFLDGLLGFILGAWVSERRVRRRIRNLEASSCRDKGELSEVTIDRMREYHRQELQRRKEIETKARDNLLAITIAFSIMFIVMGLVTTWSEETNPVHLFTATFAVMLVIGVSFLLAAGLASLRALSISMLYDLDLDEEATLDNEGKKCRLVQCVKLNQLSTTIKSNYTYASNNCIRNAIVVFFVLFLLMTRAVMSKTSALWGN